MPFQDYHQYLELVLWLVDLVTQVPPCVLVTSLASGPYDTLDILDTICRVKLDGTQASVSTQQPSEQGYLNLVSPAVRPGTKGTEEGPANSEPV